jgi:beta-galactosidase/beta-glucuronidase
MKRTFALFSILFFSATAFPQTGWKIAGDKIVTPWAEKVDPAKPLQEYPRPQMVRNSWMNLNGFWQYNILPKAQEAIPASFAGQIVVPFAVESALSGVGKTVGKDSVLWYQRSFNLPANFKNNKVLLQFGAVDWLCTVYVNGKPVGSHQGGYDPFSFDITNALTKKGNQQIAIRVWDPTDDGPQPRGKQVKDPKGIWYTPVSGIWQTVWLEAVPNTYISNTKQTPDIDNQSLHIAAAVEQLQPGDEVVVTAFKGTEKIAEQKIQPGTEATIAIANPQLWSPNHPFLYDLTLTVMRKGKKVDEVKSYLPCAKFL